MIAHLDEQRVAMRKYHENPHQMPLVFDGSSFSSLGEAPLPTNVVSLRWPAKSSDESSASPTRYEEVAAEGGVASSPAGSHEEEILNRVLSRARRLPW